MACHGDVYVALAGAARVVHCKKASYDIYIGRPSRWGNPFRVGRDGTKTQVIMKFHDWLTAQPELLEAAQAEMPGKTLGCWCG